MPSYIFRIPPNFCCGEFDSHWSEGHFAVKAPSATISRGSPVRQFRTTSTSSRRGLGVKPSIRFDSERYFATAKISRPTVVKAECASPLSALSLWGKARACDAELECLGASHASVGAYLLGLWGMTDSIVEAAAFHHRPRQCMAKDFSPLTAVHVANVLVNEMQPTEDGVMYDLNMDRDYLELCGVVDQLPAWRDMAMSGQLSAVSD